MDLVRPGLVGLGLCLAGVLLAVVIFVPLATSMDLGDAGAFAVANIPVALGAVAGGGLAGRIHPEPERADRRRHLAAALLGPLVFAAIQAAAVQPGVEGEWLARLVNLMLPPLAALAGLSLLDRRP